MKILIIEDEIKIAHAIKRALELQKYIVDAAYDGEMGLDLAVGERYDLILLDIMLPKKDGIEVCRQIRKEKISTPILMLTAKGQVDDKVIGLNTGADDYLVKPFSFEELFARIRALTRRTQEIHNSVFQIRDLVVDLSTYKVTRDGRQIRLSSREFSILEYLVRNKNKVLTKDQIINNVWNYDTEVLPSTVEVHIKHLRDKIESPHKGKQQIIKTIHGFGYEVSDD